MRNLGLTNKKNGLIYPFQRYSTTLYANKRARFCEHLLIPAYVKVSNFLKARIYNKMLKFIYLIMCSLALFYFIFLKNYTQKSGCKDNMKFQ